MKFKINIIHFIFFIHLLSFSNLTYLRRIWETEVPIDKIKKLIEARDTNEFNSILDHCEKSDAKYFIYLVNDLYYDVSDIMDNIINHDNAVSLEYSNINFYIKWNIEPSNYNDK